MAKIETKFIRKGKVILDAVSGQVVEAFESLNKAKAWSSSEQKLNGGLGMGYIRVHKEQK
jgi:hypothetical protein